MKKSLLLFSIITTFSLSVSCSNDEGNSSVELNGGTILKYQVVTVELPDTNLPDEEYSGTLGGEPITLYSGGGNTLNFMVEPDAMLGNTDLLVEDLNVTVHYDIQDIVLPGTPEEVSSEFFENQDSFISTLSSSAEDVNLAESLTAATAEYNGLSAEEKLVEAKIYFANRQLLNDMMLNTLGNRTNPGTTITPDYASESIVELVDAFIKNQRDLLKTGIITRVLPEAKLFKIRNAIMAQGHKVRIAFNIIKNYKIIVEDVKINNGNLITCYDNKDRGLSVSITERNLAVTDSDHQSDLIKNFFIELEYFNETVISLNSFLNRFPSWFGFEPIAELVLNNSGNMAERPLGQGEFQYIQFKDLSENNDYIFYSTTPSFVSDGNIKFKPRYNTSATSFPQTGKLKYTFNDGVNELTEQSVDITVFPNVEGSWTLQEYGNGLTPGPSQQNWTNEYTNPNCPGIVSGQIIINSMNITINENFTYNSTETGRYKNYSLNPSTCSQGTITVTNYQENDNGIWALDENTYVGSSLTTGETFPIHFITRDRVSVGDKKFSRN